MKNAKNIYDKLVFISRSIFLAIFVLMFLSWITLEIKSAFDIKWIFVDLIIKSLQITTFLMFISSWITPGLLIIFGNPNLVYSWLRGINPIGFSNASWEKLSNGEKVLVYITAIILTTFTLLFLYWTVSIYYR